MSITSEGWRKAPAGATLPEGLRIYAIGDVHGRFDLLEELTAAIGRELRESRPARTVEIFLGDYIDRGPRSREVVAWLTAAPPLADERICLMGNHEELLLEALDDVSAVSNWLFNGGGETLMSYLAVESGAPQVAGDVHAALVRALPETHRAFVAALPRTVSFGRYLFVHAGVRPKIPLSAQDPHDLVWIREPFLSFEADFGWIVIHGHTPVAHPDIRPNRINIDTGAVFTGRLTCLVLEGSALRFIQAEQR